MLCSAERDFSLPTTNSAPPELPPSRAGRQTALHRPQDWASPLDASFRRPSAKTGPLIGCLSFPLILCRSTSYWLWPFSLSTPRRNTKSLGSLTPCRFFFRCFSFHLYSSPNDEFFFTGFVSFFSCFFFAQCRAAIRSPTG